MCHGTERVALSREGQTRPRTALVKLYQSDTHCGGGKEPFNARQSKEKDKKRKKKKMDAYGNPTQGKQGGWREAIEVERPLPPPPPNPTYLPPSHYAKSTTNKGELRVQDTGNSPHRAWIGSDRNSTYDPESSTDVTGRVCTVLWDTGAQISLVTHQYARDAGFKGCPASIQISGVGTGNKNRSRIQYRVLLKKRDRSVVEFTL